MRMDWIRMIPADLIVKAIAGAVREVANDSSTSLQPSQAPAVEQKIKDAIANSPRVQHVTNSEPWYQSRVTIGALVTMASGALGLAGFVLDAEDVALATNAALGAGAMIGACITLYGRWRAKKPIGA